MSRLDVRRPSPVEDANEQVFTTFLDNLRSTSVLPEERMSAEPGCLWCALDDARDRERTARWLSVSAARGRDSLGVACCPLHIWRVYALAEGDAAGNAQTLGAVHALYQRSLDQLRTQIHQATAHVDVSGPARWLRGAHALAPGLLHLRPACPLCSERSRQAPEERRAIAAWLAQRLEAEPAWLRRSTLAGACHHHAPALAPESPPTAPGPPAPSHNRLDEPVAISWWQGPGASEQGAALLWRVLGEARGGIEEEQDARPLPDGLCPLCVARWEHESAALRALARGEWTEAVAHNALCARHHAFVRTPTAIPADAAVTVEGLAKALRQTPAGALTGSAADDACPVCVTVRGWELARIEGLRRASGGALLYEQVTEHLIQRLVNAKYQFCLPHLRKLLNAGARERVWETLGASVERGLETLHQRTAPLARDGETPALGASYTRLMLAAALGGLPV